MVCRHRLSVVPISSSTLDDSDVQQFMTGLSSPAAVAVARGLERVCWLEHGSEAFERTTIDGTPPPKEPQSTLPESHPPAATSQVLDRAGVQDPTTLQLKLINVPTTMTAASMIPTDLRPSFHPSS